MRVTDTICFFAGANVRGMQDTPLSSAWVRWPVTVISFLIDAEGRLAN